MFSNPFLRQAELMETVTDNAFPLYAAQQNRLNMPMSLKQKAIEDETLPPAAKEKQGEVTFDDLLVAIGKTRNRDAFIRVFEYFAPRVKSFLMKGGLTQELADELAQETMLSVWQKAAQYNPAQAAASTWIFTIARNKRIDYFRKAGRPEPDANDPLMNPETDMPDDIVNRGEQGKLLAAALKKLPPEQAELVQKSFFEEKTHNDIAAEADIPLGTVKSRIRLALERLRHEMREIRDDHEGD